MKAAARKAARPGGTRLLTAVIRPAPKVSMTRAELIHAASLCTAADHLYFDAIDSLNELTGKALDLLDAAVANGTMPMVDYNAQAARIAAATSQGTRAMLQLREGDIGISQVLSHLSKSMRGLEYAE